MRLYLVDGAMGNENKIEMVNYKYQIPIQNQIKEMAKISYTITSMTAGTLCEMKRKDELVYPTHQRDFVWSKVQQLRFRKSVLDGMPTSSLMFRKIHDGCDSKNKMSIEDGRQRLTTIMNWIDSKEFSELSLDEKEGINKYVFAVIIYADAIEEKVPEMFVNINSGVKLSVGELLNSVSGISPLVKMTIKLLMTPGEGVYEEAIKIWGVKDSKNNNNNNKGQKYLAMQVALVSGLLWGTKAMTMKWSVYEKMGYHLKTELDESMVTRKVMILICIFNEAISKSSLSKISGHAREISSTLMNILRDIGMFSGYIIHYLDKYGWEDGKNIVKLQEVVLEILEIHKFWKKGYNPLHVGMEGNAWNEKRWELGCDIILSK